VCKVKTNPLPCYEKGRSQIPTHSKEKETGGTVIQRAPNANQLGPVSVEAKAEKGGNKFLASILGGTRRGWPLESLRYEIVNWKTKRSEKEKLPIFSTID